MIPDSIQLQHLTMRRELAFYAKHFYPAVFRPLPKQGEFMASKAKISVLCGGNRSGKTECGAIRASLLANGILGKFVPGFPDDGRPTKGLVSGLDYKVLTRSIKPKLEKALGRSIASWREKDQSYRLKNGSTIWLMSEESGEQKYQAIDIDWAWKDEFGDLKSEGVVNEILRGLVDRNGNLFVTATPTLGSSWAGPLWFEPWRDACREEDGVIHYCKEKGHCSANGVTFFFMDTVDNCYLSQEALNDWVARQVTEEQKAVRLRGRFVVLEGLVYSKFDPTRHVIDSFPIPREWQKWRGMDWGLSAPSTCLWAALEPANEKQGPRLHIYRELYDQRIGKTVEMTCNSIKEMSGDEAYNQTVLDPSCWNRDPAPMAVGGFFIVADEYGRNGVYAERANHEVEASVERLWRYFGTPGTTSQLVIHRNCTNLIRELRRQRWKKGVNGLTQATGKLSDQIEKSDPDHAIDALRYIVMAGPLEDSPYHGAGNDPFNSVIEDHSSPEWVIMADGQVGLRMPKAHE